MSRLIYSESDLDTWSREGDLDDGYLWGIGDSWFDYPLKHDILEIVSREVEMPIYKMAHYGYELAQMFSGEEKAIKIKRMQDYGRHMQGILLSCGGNDIVGPNLYCVSDYRNGASAAFEKKIALLGLLLEDALQMFEVFLQRTVPVFIHCYDWPIPSDRGYRILGHTFAGPWIRPILTPMFPDDAMQREICRYMIDAYAGMLSDLGTRRRNLMLIDTRGTIHENQWDNEIHPTETGFKTVADLFKARVSAGLG